jgi:hypothetical protein
MVKFIPLVLLTTLLTAGVVAAPKPAKEGLVSHNAAGKAYVVDALPDINGGPWITARLRIDYVVAGQPGETYVVELWLGRTGWTKEDPCHFDTQKVTIPGDKGGKLTEVKEKFDRRYHDRPRPVHGNPPKPGEASLFGVERGKSWDCRLVVKRDGRVVSDTGYFRAVLDPVIEI